MPNDGEAHTVAVLQPPSASLAGAQYAILLVAPLATADTAWVWAVDSLNGYPGGNAFDGDTAAGTWSTRLTDDQTFATWVEPSVSDPPTIACSASPGVLWPPNGKLVPIAVTVTTTNATIFTLVSVVANEAGRRDVQGWSPGAPDVNGLLRASRRGHHDRVYTLTYRAANAAGDAATCATTVTVPPDRGHDDDDEGEGEGGDR